MEPLGEGDAQAEGIEDGAAVGAAHQPAPTTDVRSAGDDSKARCGAGPQARSGPQVVGIESSRTDDGDGRPGGDVDSGTVGESADPGSPAIRDSWATASAGLTTRTRSRSTRASPTPTRTTSQFSDHGAAASSAAMAVRTPVTCSASPSTVEAAGFVEVDEDRARVGVAHGDEGGDIGGTVVRRGERDRRARQPGSSRQVWPSSTGRNRPGATGHGGEMSISTPSVPARTARTAGGGGAPSSCSDTARWRRARSTHAGASVLGDRPHSTFG